MACELRPGYFRASFYTNIRGGLDDTGNCMDVPGTCSLDSRLSSATGKIEAVGCIGAPQDEKGKTSSPGTSLMRRAGVSHVQFC
jgi:hypothetical protein